jgi:hypothetical protein
MGSVLTPPLAALASSSERTRSVSAVSDKLLVNFFDLLMTFLLLFVVARDG